MQPQQQQQQRNSLAAAKDAPARRTNGQGAVFEVPSFYASDIEAAPAGATTTTPTTTTPTTTSNGRADVKRRTDTGHGRLLRNKCLSFVALVAALAGLGCSLASLAGTTSWVDTWEPVDLPPLDDWPALFGTGYGSLVPGRKSFTAGGKSSAYGAPKTTETHQRAWNVTPSTVPPTPTWATSASFVTTTRAPPPPPPRGSLDSEEEDEEDEDEFDYQYAQDESIGEHVDVEDSQSGEEDGEQRDEQPRRSLVVLFHIGLFRACPSLKGELPANIVLPNLPCVPLEYINWRPLSGQSFRLWRNIEFTPDFLNKLRGFVCAFLFTLFFICGFVRPFARYATPCFLLGTAISFIALAVAVTGRCSLADRTLIVSSLHILAGLSLGSGLIIFVSVLHDEFSPPTLRSPRYGNSAAGYLAAPPSRSIYADGFGGSGAVAFYPDGRTLATTITSGASHAGHASSGAGSGGSGGSGLVSAVLIPSFRYGWSFYAALAAFVGSELAAALYIVLHSHAAKWIRRNRANGDAASALKSSLPSFDLSMAPVPCKEIGVQTSPLSSASLLTMMDKRQAAAPIAAPPVDVAQQQISYCDLIAMEPHHALQTGGQEILMAPPFALEGSALASATLPPCNSLNQYISPGPANETDCTCQIHYATYRPKARNAGHVAGINKASTMPRKVAFAGDPANVYQQTPL